jgi:hypothetical protein
LSCRGACRFGNPRYGRLGGLRYTSAVQNTSPDLCPRAPSCVSAAVEVLTSIASIGFEVEGLSRCGLREEGLNMLRQIKFGGQRSMRGVAPTATRPTRGCSRPSSNETSRRCRPTCARTSWPTMLARKRPNEPARSDGPGNERSKNSLPSKPVRAPLWRQRFASVS